MEATMSFADAVAASQPEPPAEQKQVMKQEEFKSAMGSRNYEWRDLPVDEARLAMGVASLSVVKSVRVVDTPEAKVAIDSWHVRIMGDIGRPDPLGSGVMLPTPVEVLVDELIANAPGFRWTPLP